MSRTPASQKRKRHLQPAVAADSRAAANGSVIKRICLITFVLLLLSESVIVSQLSLSPVYGEIPALQYHGYLVTTLSLLSWPLWHYFGGSLRDSPLIYLPLLSWWIPTVQYYAFQYSSSLGASFGPVVTQAPIFLALISFSTTSISFELRNCGLGKINRYVTGIISQLLCFLSLRFTERPLNSILNHYIGWNQFLSRSGLQLLIAIFYSVLAPSKLLLFAIPSAVHMLLYNEHVPFGITDVVLRDTLSQHDFVLLARHESKTGYLSVLESKKEHFRVLRCDHSLLGGEWQQPPNGLEYTSRVKEPVYAVFVMLEAVRLVEVDESVAERGIPESDKTALVIGLGIGTTPSALVAHGINTTTVEIDPLVHEYAEHYFGLPLNHTTVIQDAMAFVEESNAKSTIHYDYIIHDVFTGGAEPIELFTHEFLLGLSSLLKPSGVIAINYAGDLTLPPAQIIILTIKTVFPNCRMFRENETPLSEDADFTNLVIICTKLPTPFSLRDPVEGDFLGSYARKHYLKPRYEVPSDFLDRKAIIGEDYSILRKENTKRLQEWQTKSAVGHWALMRIVLPDKVWEAW